MKTKEYHITSLPMISTSLLFLGAITVVLLFRMDKMIDYVYAPSIGNLSYSSKLSCTHGTSADANILHANVSVPQVSQDVNSSNDTSNSMEERKASAIDGKNGPDTSESLCSSLNSTSNKAIANVTTGSGDFVGPSKTVKPPSNLVPQNKEPVRLVPNLTTFEAAKNAANSGTPPNELTSSLANKNVLEPPIIPLKK